MKTIYSAYAGTPYRNFPGFVNPNTGIPVNGGPGPAVPPVPVSSGQSTTGGADSIGSASSGDIVNPLEGLGLSSIPRTRGGSGGGRGGGRNSTSGTRNSTNTPGLIIPDPVIAGDEIDPCEYSFACCLLPKSDPGCVKIAQQIAAGEFPTLG